MGARHNEQTIADGIHSAVSLSYADAAARVTATGFQAFDLHKIAVQIDDGSLWYLSNTVTPSWVQISTGAHSTGGGGGTFIPQDPGSYASIFDHFTGNIHGTTRMLDLGVLTQYNGSGSVANINGVQGHPGIVRLKALSTSTNGHGSLYLGGYSSILFGGGVVKYVFEGLLNVASVPDAVNDFRVSFGMGTDVGSGSTNVNGVAFLIERSKNTTNWVCQTSDNATFTNADSGVAFSAGWVKLRIEVNKSGTSAMFFIDDVLVSTVTTNIPVSTGREVVCMAKLQKIAGVTDLFIDLDWWHFVADKR